MDSTHFAAPPPPAWSVMPLGADDAEATVALWRAAGLTRPWNDPHADFVAALASPAATLLGIRVAGSVAGSVMVGDDAHRGWLYYLAVAPDRRGQGLGRALVRAAEAWLGARGVRKVQLMLRDGNAAGGFYAALGYGVQPVSVLGRWLGEE